MEQKAEVIEKVLDRVDVKGLAALGSIEEMERKMQEYDQKRSLIVGYIDKTFVKGVDYGASDPRSDKKTLLKPGAEKICRLYNTHPEWEKDTDTFEMLGSKAGLVCLKCRIIDNEKGYHIGEGRGVCRVGEKSTTNENTAVKIAEKRALVDAALYTFMLSEKFTQDFDTITMRSVSDAKQKLWLQVQDLRAKVDSELSDREWVMTVCQNLFHKKNISTLGETMRLMQEIENYDLSTGELIETGD